MNELELVDKMNGEYLAAKTECGMRERNIREVTEEILTIKRYANRVMLYSAVEIGKCLTEAKALLKHGEWMLWIDEKLQFSKSSAARFMQVYREYGPMILEGKTNFPHLGNLSFTNALSLLALPENERESFAEEHNVADLSNRELEKLIKERDEAIKRAEEAETAKAEVEALMEETERERDEAEAAAHVAAEREKDVKIDLDSAERKVAALMAENKELKERPVDVAVEVDEEAVKKAAEEARAETEKEWKAKLSDAEQAAVATEREMDELRAKLKEAEEKLEDAGADDRAEKERLEKEVENLSKRLMMSDRTVAIFQVHFDSVQKAWTELRRLLDEMSTEQRPKMGAALKALAAKINEEAAKC